MSTDNELITDAVLAAVDEAARLGRGDILIFMPTERDILETAKALRTHSIHGSGKTEILPLYARLSVAEQQKIFKQSPHRRIVIATNVAESSLTVPGIRYVIDTGTARISRYSSRSRTQRLPIEAVSRASADQRAGRCGRIGPGVCFRLFSQEDYNKRDRYTTPEIQRTNLASVILQMKALKLGPIEKFPFIDPPKPAAVSDGFKTLYEIGAIDENDNLTDIGWKLSRLPVDPRIGRMILAADKENCLREMLIIAAVLEIQDPRERPFEKQKKADEAHKQFLDEASDFISYLKIWDFYTKLKETLSQNQLRKACAQNFLSYNRMREWTDIHIQLLQVVRETKMTLNLRKDDFSAIHRSILTGLLSGIACRAENSEFNAAGGGKFIIWPGSGLFGVRASSPHPGNAGILPALQAGCPRSQNAGKMPALPGKWLVSAERIETTRRYLRCCSRIDPNWLEPMSQHLIKRAHFDAHWSRETGYVHAYERITLFGLTIVPKRRVNFGPIEPQIARALFIEHALIGQELDTNCEFFEHNAKIREEAKALEAKLRRHDFMRDTRDLWAFYEEQIPDDVYDRKTLEKWHKTLAAAEKQRLKMTISDVCIEHVDESVLEQFPNELHEAKIEYKFTPGETDDGLTLNVPIAQLPKLRPTELGWLVPGLLQQKIEALLRTLPKETRRHIVPIPDTAKSILKNYEFSEQTSFTDFLARTVTRLVGFPVRPSQFDESRLPPELLFNIRVHSDEGNVLAESRDLETLQKQLKSEAAAAIPAFADPIWHRDNVTSWDFGELPEYVERKNGTFTFRAFPAILDAGKSVSLRLVESSEERERLTKIGVMRLFLFAESRKIKQQVDWIPQLERLRVFAQPLPDFDLKNALGELIALRALYGSAGILPASAGSAGFQPAIAGKMPAFPGSAAEFTQLTQAALLRLGEAVVDVTKWAKPFLEAFHEARLALEFSRNAVGVGEQIRELTKSGFIRETPWRWLKEYPRYFKAIAVRLGEPQTGHGSRELCSRSMEPRAVLAEREIQKYRNRHRELLETHGNSDRLTDFRFMIEEYSVSLYAQKLGTSIKVSAVRLDKMLQNKMEFS